MSTTVDSTSSVNIPSCKTLVDTLVGLGTSWAAFGLKMGKTALVTSAETLGKTAEALETLAATMEKKAAEAKAENEVGAPADAPVHGDASEADPHPAA